MAERLNCVQNAITIRNQLLIRNKVAGFIIVGGQDNIQGVAGHCSAAAMIGNAVPPSTASRTMSAWPAWREVS